MVEPGSEAAEAARKERLKQMFGADFKTDAEKELARSEPVRQTPQPEAPPEWMVDPQAPAPMFFLTLS